MSQLGDGFQCGEDPYRPVPLLLRDGVLSINKGVHLGSHHWDGVPLCRCHSSNLTTGSPSSPEGYILQESPAPVAVRYCASSALSGRPTPVTLSEWRRMARWRVSRAPLTGVGKGSLQRVSSVALHVGGNVRVEVEGHSDVGVAEPFLHDLPVDALRQ